MNRKAVIVGAPGGYKNEYLSGVDIDVKNYINFLKSPTGGAWDSSEIIAVRNPDKEKLSNYLSGLKVDYSLVIFSGHGAYQIDDSTYVAINRTQLLSVKNLVTKAPKQLMIVDACRSFVDSGISGFLGEEVKQFPSCLTKAQAKETFNRHIAKCEPGIVVCYSSSIGQSSYSKNDGGVFTLNLLNTTKSWVATPSSFGILPINTAFTRSKNYTVKNTRGKQVPELVSTKSRSHWFPFAVRKPINLI